MWCVATPIYCAQDNMAIKREKRIDGDEAETYNKQRKI